MMNSAAGWGQPQSEAEEEAMLAQIMALSEKETHLNDWISNVGSAAALPAPAPPAAVPVPVPVPPAALMFGNTKFKMSAPPIKELPVIGWRCCIAANDQLPPSQRKYTLAWNTLIQLPVESRNGLLCPVGVDGDFDQFLFGRVKRAFLRIRFVFPIDTHLRSIFANSRDESTHLVSISFYCYLLFGPEQDYERWWLLTRWASEVGETLAVPQPPFHGGGGGVLPLSALLHKHLAEAVGACIAGSKQPNATFFNGIRKICRNLYFSDGLNFGLPQQFSAANIVGSSGSRLMKRSIQYWSEMSHAIIACSHLHFQSSSWNGEDAIQKWFCSQTTLNAIPPHTLAHLDVTMYSRNRTKPIVPCVLTSGSMSQLTKQFSFKLPAVAAAASASEDNAAMDLIVVDAAASASPPPLPGKKKRKRNADENVNDKAAAEELERELPIWPCDSDFGSLITFIPTACLKNKKASNIFRLPEPEPEEEGLLTASGGLPGRLYLSIDPLDLVRLRPCVLKRLFAALGFGYPNVYRAYRAIRSTYSQEFGEGLRDLHNYFVPMHSMVALRSKYELSSAAAAAADDAAAEDPYPYPFLKATPKFTLRVDQLQTLAFLTECETQPLGELSMDVQVTPQNGLRSLLFPVGRTPLVVGRDTICVDDLLHGGIDASSMGVGKSVTVVALCDTMAGADTLLVKRRWWTIGRCVHQPGLCSADDCRMGTYTYRYPLPEKDNDADESGAQQQPAYLTQASRANSSARKKLLSSNVWSTGTLDQQFEDDAPSLSAPVGMRSLYPWKWVSAVPPPEEPKAKKSKSLAVSVSVPAAPAPVAASVLAPAPAPAAATVVPTPPPKQPNATSVFGLPAADAAAAPLPVYPMRERYSDLKRIPPLGGGSGGDTTVLARLIPSTHDRMAKTLLLCPSAIVGQWGDFFRDHSTAQLSVQNMHTATAFRSMVKKADGVSKHQKQKEEGEAWPDVLVLSWIALNAQSVRAILEETFFCRIIIDEFHQINPTSARFKTVQRLKARARFVLTGTPNYKNILPWVFPAAGQHLQSKVWTKSLVHMRSLRHDKACFNGKPILKVQSIRYRVHQCPMHPDMLAMLRQVYQAANVGGAMRHQVVDAYRNLIAASIATSEQTLKIILDRLKTLSDRSTAVHMAQVNPRALGKAPEESFTLRDEECAICFEDFTKPLQTNCRHVMCKECITEWLHRLSNRSCPVCRLSVSQLFLPHFPPREGAAGAGAAGDVVDEEEEEEENKDKVVPIDAAAAAAAEAQAAEQKKREEACIFMPKVTKFVEEIQRAVAEGPESKILVFVARKASLTLYRRQLDKLGLAYYSAGPGQSNEDKELEISRFRRDPSVQILLCLQRTAAAGVDLSIANHLFIMDLTDKTSAFLQMVGRVDREGQKQQPQVHLFLVPGTAEEFIFHQARMSRVIDYHCVSPILRLFNLTYIDPAPTTLTASVQRWTTRKKVDYRTVTASPILAADDSEIVESYKVQLKEKFSALNEAPRDFTVDRMGWVRRVGDETNLFTNVHFQQ